MKQNKYTQIISSLLLIIASIMLYQISNGAKPDDEVMGFFTAVFGTVGIGYLVLSFIPSKKNPDI